MSSYFKFFVVPWFYAAILGGIISFIIIIAWFRNLNRASLIASNIQNILVWSSFLFSGAWLAALHSQKKIEIYVSPWKNVRFVVREEPYKTKYFTATDGFLLLQSPEGQTLSQGHQVRFYKEFFESTIGHIQVGDTLIFSAAILPFAPAKKPGDFNSRLHFADKGLYSYSNIRESSNLKLLKGPGHRYGFIVKVRKMIDNQLKEYFTDYNYKNLVTQMLIGERGYVDEDIKSAFKNTGVMHILAVSGLHVGIIYLILNALSGLIFPRSWHTLSVIVVISIVWSYAVLAGFKPSVVRATLMLSFFSLGKLLNRQVNLLNTLSAAAFVNLLFKPTDLFDLGFKLSYSAVAGIALLFEPIKGLWNPSRFLLRKFWEMTALTLSAQAGTTGVSIFYFGQFPLLFVFANWLAIPAASIIIYSALIFVLIPFPFVKSLLAVFLESFLEIFIRLLKLFDSFSFSTIKNLEFDAKDAILITILIIFILGIFLRPYYQSFLKILVIIIIWIFSDILIEAYSIFSKERLLLISPQKEELSWVVQKAPTFEKFFQPHINLNQNAIIQWRNYSSILYQKPATEPYSSVKATYLIFNNKKFTFNKIKKLVKKNQHIILGPAINASRALRIKKELEEIGFRVWSIHLDGYFKFPQNMFDITLAI